MMCLVKCLFGNLIRKVCVNKRCQINYQRRIYNTSNVYTICNNVILISTRQ